MDTKEKNGSPAWTDPRLIAVNLCWDLHTFMQNPEKVIQLLERIENGTASGYDRFLAGIMKKRIERFNGDDPGLKRLKEILSKV
ncbi:hypothetical protein [Persephonella sp.]